MKNYKPFISFILVFTPAIGVTVTGCSTDTVAVMMLQMLAAHVTQQHKTKVTYTDRNLRLMTAELIHSISVDQKSISYDFRNAN